MKEGYIPQEQRKKILLLTDDIRLPSGVGNVGKEIVIGTAHHYNWVNLGAAINHPDAGKRFDLSQSTNESAGVDDSSVYLYPSNGYGDPNVLRQIIKIEKPDAIMMITPPILGSITLSASASFISSWPTIAVKGNIGRAVVFVVFKVTIIFILCFIFYN